VVSLEVLSWCRNGRECVRGRSLEVEDWRGNSSELDGGGHSDPPAPPSNLFWGLFFWGHLSNKVVFIPLVVCLSAGIPPYLRAFAATGGYYMHTEVLRPYVSLPESVPELTNE